MKMDFASAARTISSESRAFNAGDTADGLNDNRDHITFDSLI
jgi:hypothetical protein